MSTGLSRDECDFIVQGAVVLACGGGGPLHFARHVLDELYDDDTAKVEAPQNVRHDAWMTMIALVGTPSKVHNDSACRLHGPSSANSSRRGSFSASGSPFLTAKSVGHSQAEILRRLNRPILKRAGFSEPLRTKSTDNSPEEKPQSTIYEVVKMVQRMKFMTPGSSFDYDENPCPCHAARNTFAYLEKQCQARASDKIHYPRYGHFDRFSYILTGELGAVNMATALYLSAIYDVAVVDCDGAGRSVPMINQITYADRFTVSPTAIMSPQPGPDFDSIPSTLLDFPCGTEKMIEEIAGTLISDQNGPFHPYIGYGTYVITGEQMGDVPVFGSYSTALEVGKAMESFVGEARAATVSNVLLSHGRKNSVVFHGYVTEKVLQNSKVKDIGHLVVTDVNDRQNRLKLWYQNEIILAGRPGEPPSYMAPDSICILPAHDAPIDISSIPDEGLDADDRLEVFVLVIQADDKIKNQKVIQSFESIYKMFKNKCGIPYYDRKYVPWGIEENEGSKIDDLSEDDEDEDGAFEMNDDWMLYSIV